MQCNSATVNVVILSLLIMAVIICNFIALNISYSYDHHDYYHYPHAQENFSISNDTKPLPASKIPLNELIGNVSSSEDIACKQKGGFMFYDTILPESITHTNRKIPKVVHFTSRTRCLSKVFYDNVQKWRLANHSVYLHDEDAMNKLMFKKWNLFPHLQEVMKCVGRGAEKADIWRYLLIWEYGGIYTDIDNCPGKDWDENTIKPTDDAYFLQEGERFPSQWFFAASVRHPILYFTMMHALYKLTIVEDLSRKRVPLTTGPWAIKMGVWSFINDGYPTPGNYKGIDNRKLTICDNLKNRIVRRESVFGKGKHDGLQEMGMKHYHKHNVRREKHACLHQLYYKRNHTLTTEDMDFRLGT